MDNEDRLLIARLLKGLPINGRPFHSVALDLGLEDCDVLLRVEKLKREKEIEFLGALPDPAGAGLKQFLVGLAVQKRTEENAAEVLSQHPGVLSCSKRAHELNIWFDIGLAGYESFRSHVRRIIRLTGATKAVVAARPGSIKKFEPTTEDNIDRLEKRVLEALTDDFPLNDEPFLRIAEKLGVREIDLLAVVQKLIRDQLIRRVGIEVGEKKSTPAEADLVAWEVPEERKREFLEKASSEGVSKIYLNAARSSDFRYSILTLSSVEAIGRIAAGGQDWPREYYPLARTLFEKKVSYFSGAFDAWKGRTLECSSDVLQDVEGLPGVF